MILSNIGTITRKALYGTASYNGQLIIAGVEGSIVRARVTPQLNPVEFLEYSRNAGENFFLVAGKPDQQFTLDSLTNITAVNATNWVTGPKLEFLDSSGTLLIVQPRPPLPREFYRGTLVTP